MTELHIPSKALILVCDGRKALFLRNIGDATHPNLKVEDVFSRHGKSHTADLGTDRPGRMINRASGQNSAVEQVDWHDLAEKQFAHVTAEALERLEREGEISALIVVAPPRTLAELRGTMSEHVKHKIIAELHKDLTKHPVSEIQHHLTTAD